MGSNSSSTAATDVKINQSNKSSSDITNNTPLSSSSCPVSKKHNKITPSIVSASQSTTDSVTVSIENKGSESSCPVKYKNPEVFNVYNTKINPSNQMPSVPNQSPSSSQEVSLSVNRVSSTIPKGGTEDDTWTYPSPQMFWNALVRKDKIEGVTEKDVDSVIAIHNNMNENTWYQVMEWEKLRADWGKIKPGCESKLLRFLGRPDEYSPKARIKMLFGHPAPFDRHDWIIDRGYGKEVRYIIDYYHDESSIQEDKTPKHLQDAKSIQSIKVDVRPALDSPYAIVDRIFFMPWKQFNQTTKFNPPPFFPTNKMIKAEENKIERIKSDWKEIATKCFYKKQDLTNCKSEEECRAASVALQLCTASVICPSIAKDFIECTSKLNGNNQKEKDFKKASASYSAMLQCLELFEIDNLKILNGKKTK